MSPLKLSSIKSLLSKLPRPKRNPPPPRPTVNGGQQPGV